MSDCSNVARRVLADYDRADRAVRARTDQASRNAVVADSARRWFAASNQAALTHSPAEVGRALIVARDELYYTCLSEQGLISRGEATP